MRTLPFTFSDQIFHVLLTSATRSTSLAYFNFHEVLTLMQLHN